MTEPNVAIRHAQECEKNTAFALALVAVLPVVTVSAATSTPIGGGESISTTTYNVVGTYRPHVEVRQATEEEGRRPSTPLVQTWRAG